MSNDQQPQAEWIFPEKPKKRAGRVWLIIGLVVAVLVIAGAVLFFVIPRDKTPGASVDPTPTASATPSSTPSATPSDVPLPTEEPSGPVVTPPPVPDPEMGIFVGQVQPWLDDAVVGLDMIANMTGQEAAQVIDSLQGDADRLAGVIAPSSISSEWYDDVNEYSTRLTELNAAVNSGGGADVALENARAALQTLRGIAGI